MRKRVIALGIIGLLTISACSIPNNKIESKSTEDKQTVEESETDNSQSTEESQDTEQDNSADNIQSSENEQLPTDSNELDAETSNEDKVNSDDANSTEDNNGDDVQSASIDETLSVDTKNTDQSSSSSQSGTDPLITKVLEGTGVDINDVKDSLIDDFDGDGTREGFVFIGGDIDVEWSTCLGQLYYVSDSKKEMLENTEFVVTDGKIIHSYPVSNKTFIGVDQAYTTSSVTVLYNVINGECRESAVSRIGSFFKPDYIDGYAISLSCYDMMFDYEPGKEDEGMYTGHTWKHYYFYYDEAAGDFREYLGKLISEEELAAACGFDLAGEIRAEGNQVDSIMRRDNGIINVNYSSQSEYEDGTVSIRYSNATFNEKTKEFFNVWADGENTWQNSDFGGVYLTAITLQ